MESKIKSLFVTAKQLANALQKHLRTGERAANAIRKTVKKGKGAKITRPDVAEHYGLTDENTDIFLDGE